MPLRLQVISAHRESMGGSYIQEFAACGGTIGRSLECDWPLPDSKRYISSRHALIDYQGGCYYLVDLSRNGIYINDEDSPVGSGNPQRLFDGDRLKLGEFEIQVAIIDDPTEPNEDGMGDSIIRAQMVAEDDAEDLSMISPDQMNESPALEAMLKPGGGSGELSALTELPEGASSLLHQTGLSHGIAEAADEFIVAAGLNPNDFKGIEPKELLQRAAQLLAEFAEGTHDLLVSKDAITERFKLNDSDGDTHSNPLRSSESMGVALRLLLAPGNDMHLSGEEALDAAFDELARHQRAVVTAMSSALAYYLGYFEPDALDQLFTELKKRGSSKSEFRDLYAEAYQGLSKPNKYRLPQRFDEEFARAYEDETSD